MSTLLGLPKDLMDSIFKRGYFLLTTKRTTGYWVDLFSLSHLFNADEKALRYRELLKGMLRDIIQHQQKELNINAVICPRFTCSTEDLFSETLLNICFELQIEEPELFREMTIFELFSAGEKDSYYLNPVNKDYKTGDIRAVALFALDIHFGQIESLQKMNKDNLSIYSMISVVGRCEPKKRDFKVIPLFDAWNDGTPESEFTFIMNENSKLHQRIFTGGDLDCKKYIPFENWKAKYAL